MADVDATLRLWSSTPGSNKPIGSTSIGTGLDDNLREIQAVVKKFLGSAASSMASAGTVDLSTANGFYIEITGTTTITAFGTEGAGLHYLLRFSGALTLTHNATSLILPGGQNITTAAGDLAWMISEGSGNWRCAHYSPADGGTVLPSFYPANHIFNGALAFSVGSSALTCSLKTQDGGDPSTTDKVVALFRHTTDATGTFTVREVSAALSLVVSSGSTLGHGNTVAGSIYHYLIDNVGTVEYAVSNKFHGYNGQITTVAEGGGGAADSASSMYSTTARTSVPFICLGRTQDTQTTAGTWAAVPTVVELAPFPRKAGTIQTFTSDGTYTKPWDLLAAIVEVVGGGGGGGGSDRGTSSAAGGGGGGGGYARQFILAETIGATETVTRGAGGAGGSATVVNGVAGGTSSFGALLSATGGGLGVGSLNPAAAAVTAGGSGGVGSSGDLNVGGEDGASGFVTQTDDDAFGGDSGGTAIGGGAAGTKLITSASTAGVAGNAYGSGGSGSASTNATGASGGSGANGIIYVTEFYI